MTRLLLADIPPTAQQSLESLHCWSGSVLAYLYPDLKSVEAIDAYGNEVDVRCITAGAFFNTASVPTGWRFISRFSGELLPEVVTGGSRWSYIKDLGSLAIPESFKR